MGDPARQCNAGPCWMEGVDKTVAPARQAYHGAGSKAKRSPKDRSVIPGTVAEVPKSSGQPSGAGNSDQMGQSDGPAPAGKIVEVWGQAGPMAGACRPMPSAQALTNRQDSRDRLRSREMREEFEVTDRYGKTRIHKIRAAQNDLREAIRAEGTPSIQDAWDRLEPWLDMPAAQPMTSPGNVEHDT